MRRTHLGFLWLGSLALLALLTLLVEAACSAPAGRSARTVSEARSAAARGEMERAARLLQARLRFAPHDVAATTELARLRLAQGRPGEARRILEDLPDDAPRDTAFRRLRARLAVESGSVRAAAPLLAALAARGESEPEVVERFLDQVARTGTVPDFVGEMPARWRRQLLRRFLACGNVGAAASIFELLPAGDPHRSEIRERLLEVAVARHKTAHLEAHPELLAGPESPAALLARYRRALAEGRGREAAALEDRFVARYPRASGLGEMLLAKARRLLAAGRPQEALHLADRASRLDPSDAAPLLQRALALEALGRRAEARRALERAALAAPHDAAVARLLERYGGAPEEMALRIRLEREQ